MTVFIGIFFSQPVIGGIMGEQANIAGMCFKCRADAALTITYADEGARTVCGYTPAELVDTGFLSLPDLIHPDERDKARSTIQAGLTGKTTFLLWTHLQVKDRSPAEGIIIGSGSFAGPLSLSGIEGYIIRVLATPEYTKTGEALSPEICLQLLSHTEELIALLDNDGVLSYITPSVTKVLGMKQTAITGLPFSQLLLPTEQKRFEEFRSQILTAGTSSARFGFVHPDGQNSYLLVRMFKPGGISGSIVSISPGDDLNGVSEGKDLLYHDLFTRMPVPAIITTAEDMRIQEINHAAREYTQDSPVSLTGSDLRDIGVISTATIEQLRESLGIANQAEGTDTDSEGRHIHVMAREIQSGDKNLIIWTFSSGQAQGLSGETGERSEPSRETRHSYVSHLQTVRNIFAQKQLSTSTDPELAMRYGKIFLDSVIQLYETGGGKGGGINVCRYIRRIVEQITEEFTEELIDIDLTVRCPDDEILSEKHASALGIITGEAVFNALSHAFEPGQAGRIEVSLLHEEDWHIFQVQDTGKGLPESVIKSGSGASGLTIIENLSIELSGTMTLANDGGAVVRVIFPDSL